MTDEAVFRKDRGSTGAHPGDPDAAPLPQDLPQDTDTSGWCLVDPHGAVLCASDAWLRSTGLTLAQVLGRDILALFPESRDMAAAMHARARAGHRLRVPRHLQAVGGRAAWWEGTIEPVHMTQGVGLLIRAYPVAADAPARAAEPTPAPVPTVAAAAPSSATAALQQAHERLLESVSLVQAISESSPDVIYAKDRDGRMRYANPAALALIGKPAEQVLGHTDAEFLNDPDAARQVMDNDRHVMASGRPQELEEHVPLPDGSRRVWLSLKVPYRDPSGQVAGLLGISRDATARQRLENERRQALEQLQRSEERLRMAMESSSLGWWDMDIRTWAVFWSDSAQRMFDLGADEVALHAALSRIHPEDRPGVEAAIAAALDPLGGGDYRASYRVVWRDGTTRWIDAVGRVQFAPGMPQPQAQRFTGVLWDVTAQRQLLQSLQDADRVKNVFLATLAHELRNPLAPLRNAAQLLGATALRGDQLRWVQRVIERQVSHMARLLDDLLDVARITQGKLQLQPQRVSLASIVESAVEAARPLIEHKRHALTVALEDGDAQHAGLVLDADPVRLSQVLSNLLTNAAKYTDAGGHIGLSARRQGAELLLQVRDSGIGIAPEARSHVFEMFAQLAPGAGHAEGGLGIGLALVRGIVELHGGSVDVESDGPGRGSCFSVRLPLHAAPPLSAPAQARPPARLAGTRVLVADDNGDAAQTLALLLDLEGCETRVATGGTQAVELAAQWTPDVAVLDIGLPDLDGHAVARALRALPAGGRMRLIALTGWGQDADRQRSSAAGFDHHMTKPADIEQLLALVAAPGLP